MIHSKATGQLGRYEGKGEKEQGDGLRGGKGEIQEMEDGRWSENV